MSNHAALLAATTLADATGLRTVGTVLGGIVTVLALLAAVTGLCVGCESYRLLARLRGIRSGQVGAFDLAELGDDGDRVTVVGFTHPLCSNCRELEQRLAGGERPLLSVDVSKRPDLARRYHVTVVPTAFAVAADGSVIERLA